MSSSCSLDDTAGVQHVTYRGLSQEKFDKRYGKPRESEPSLCEKLSQYRKHCLPSCTAQNVFRFAERRVPGIRVVRTYRFRKYILGDVIAGLSVGIVTIPQSLGYALLASVPPILGLYTCFIAAIVYFLFGTSRHIAMGTMALTSLIISTAVEKGTAHIVEEMKHSNNSNLTLLLEQEQTNIAVSVTFLGGLVLVLMSFFQLGFIVSYIGDAFVSGYLTGANINVLTHQIIFCLGLKEYLSSHTGFLNYFYLVYDVCKNIPNINVASLVVSIITMAVVIGVKYGINERFKSRLKVPIPIELIVVIIGIIVSHFARLNARFGVRVLYHVPQGLPSPTPPNLAYMKNYTVEAILTGIVSFVFAAIMAKLFSQRHDYPLDNNQELFASGMCNAVGGLFSCIGVSVSPPRAFLMEMTGGNTQVAYLINAVIILLCLLFLAPLLVALPVCILACLVITSCIPLFVHYGASVTYWRTNKYDFSIYLVTMLATVMISVDLGMVLGVGYSFVVVVFQSQMPYTSTLARHEEDGVVLDGAEYSTSVPVDGVKIYRFESPLYFATLDVFKQTLFASVVSVSELKKRKAISEMQNLDKKPNAQEAINLKTRNEYLSDDEEKVGEADSTLNTPLTHRKHVSQPCDNVEHASDFHALVIDCSCIPFADTPGARLLAKLYKEYKEQGVTVLLAAVSHKLLLLLHRVPECEDLVDIALYPSVHDAILYASAHT